MRKRLLYSCCSIRRVLPVVAIGSILIISLCSFFIVYYADFHHHPMPNKHKTIIRSLDSSDSGSSSSGSRENDVVWKRKRESLDREGLITQIFTVNDVINKTTTSVTTTPTTTTSTTHTNRARNRLDNTVTHQTRPTTNTNTNTMVIIPPHKNPRVSHSSSPSSSFTGWITLYWIDDSEKFSYLNYKSLESLLVIYPNTKIRIRILGPEQCHYYQVGHILSKQTFQKYSKQGHSIKTIIQTPSSDKQQWSTLPGFQYWQNAFQQFYPTKAIGGMGSFRHAPFYLTFYDRLVTLYLDGGISSDFNWFHINEMSLLNDFQPTDEIERRDDNSDNNKKENLVCSMFRVVCDEPFQPCFGSILLVVPHKKHPFIKCLLDQYESNETSETITTNSTSSLLYCINHGDMVNGGMYCIQKAINSCLLVTNTTNIFSANSNGEHHQEGVTRTRSSCYDSVTGYNYHMHHSPWCLSTKTDTANRYMSEYNVSCAPYLTSYDENLFDTNTTSTTSIHHHHSSSSLPVIWLGRKSVSGNWKPPQPSSIIHNLIKKNDAILQERVEQYFLKQEKVTNPLLLSPPQQYCSHYSTFPDTTLSSQYQANLSCSIHFVIPGFMKSGSSFIYETLADHPMIVRAVRGTQFKETGCYLPQSLTMKKRDHRLQCFPFLEAHDHVIVGDATVFYAFSRGTPEQLLIDNPAIKVIFSLRHPIERIQSHHRFDFHSFQSIGYGNINECLWIAIQPDSKLSQWRNVVVQVLAYVRDHHLYHGKKMTWTRRECPPLDHLMQLYQAGLKKNVSFSIWRCYNLLLHSLYFLPIFQWYEIIPLWNIRVIRSELFDPRKVSFDEKKRLLREVPFVDNMTFPAMWYNGGEVRSIVHGSAPNKKTSSSSNNNKKKKKLSSIDQQYLLHQFNGLHRFLGLPERERMKAGGGHETIETIPLHLQLNDTMRALVSDFIEPFNDLLDAFMTHQQQELLLI